MNVSAAQCVFPNVILTLGKNARERCVDEVARPRNRLSVGTQAKSGVRDDVQYGWGERTHECDIENVDDAMMVRGNT